MRKPETVFKEKVKKDLEKLKKTWFVKVQQVAIRGIPDYLMCINGTFIGLELKEIDGVASKLQVWNLEGIAHAGGLAIVVDPPNWPQVYELLVHLSESPEKEGEYAVHH